MIEDRDLSTHLNILTIRPHEVETLRKPDTYRKYECVLERFLELDFHRHSKGEIVLVQRGAFSCEMEGGLWVVPPRSAVWITRRRVACRQSNGRARML
jgi:hypothetical protein